MTKTIKIFLLIVLVAVVGLAVGYQWGKSAASKAGPGVKEAIKIGFIGPLTGEAATIGQNTRAGIELAVEKINEGGGINGQMLEVIFEDGKASPKDAVDAANKLISIDKVAVIIGGLASGETLAASPIAEKAKTILFSPCSSSPDITKAGDYVFRNYPSDIFQGKVAAETAYHTLGARSAAILRCSNEACLGLDRVFRQRFEELDGDVLTTEVFEQASNDLRTQLTKIKTVSPDLIYFVGYTDSAITGLRQIKELGIEAQVLGADAWDDPKIPEAAGEAAEGIMFTIPLAPLNEQFKTMMELKTGTKEVTVCTPQAYDAVNLISEMMKKVGPDAEKIKDELYQVEDYQGVSGVITFDRNGDLTSAEYLLKVIKEGKAVPYEK